MRILVLGAGAMGSLYGGLLKETGNDVTLVDVSKEHIDRINQGGLRLEALEEKKVIPIEAKYAHEIKDSPELILLFTKTIHSKSALDSIKKNIDDKTIILSLQNGLGNDKIIQEYVPESRIIIGTTNFPSDLIEPGFVKSKGQGATKIMSLDGKVSEQLEQIKTILNKAGFNCTITEEVFVSIWEKVAFNAACNALTAVTRLRLGHVGSTEEGKELARLIVNEVIGIAHMKKINANADSVIQLVEEDFIEHAEHMPSMLQDVLNKRETEIDFINGAVVSEAEALGVEIPVTKTLYQLISIIQKNYDGVINI